MKERRKRTWWNTDTRVVLSSIYIYMMRAMKMDPLPLNIYPHRLASHKTDRTSSKVTMILQRVGWLAGRKVVCNAQLRWQEIFSFPNTIDTTWPVFFFFFFFPPYLSFILRRRLAIHLYYSVCMFMCVCVYIKGGRRRKKKKGVRNVPEWKLNCFHVRVTVGLLDGSRHIHPHSFYSPFMMLQLETKSIPPVRLIILRWHCCVLFSSLWLISPHRRSYDTDLIIYKVMPPLLLVGMRCLPKAEGGEGERV